MYQPRNPFGLDLETAMTVGQPIPQFPQQQTPQIPPQAPKMSKGQLIAGILADALAGAMGRPGQFAQRLGQQQQQEQEEVQWGRRRQAEREDKQWEWQNKPRDLGSPHRWEDNAGNQWEMGTDGKPRPFFIDRVEKQFVHEGMLNKIPNPYATAVQPAPPEVIDENTWNTGKPVGGQASPTPATFPYYPTGRRKFP